MTVHGHISSVDLLRRLDPVARSLAPAAPIPPNDSQEFDQLLARALRGEIRSERAVRCLCELTPPLDAAQLQRLAMAADRAEAQGVTRVLLMIDGRGIEVDLPSRTVISELRSDNEAALLRVDAAMVVPGGSDAGRATRGSPFAGINDLTAARAMLAAESRTAATRIAPKPR